MCMDDNDLEPEPDDSLMTPCLSNENLQPSVVKTKKTRKRKRQGRSNWSNKKIRHEKQIQILDDSKNTEAFPRRSGRQTRAISTLSLVSEDDDVSDGSQRSSLFSSIHGKKRRTRLIATEEDHERALDFVEKRKVDTPDGQFYYLYECTKCFRQFSHTYNARRHIVSLHLGKRFVTRYPKTMEEPASTNVGRSSKIQLYDSNEEFPTGKNNSTSKSKSCRRFSINKSKIRPEYSAMDREIIRQSRNRSSFSQIPPNLIVRNPCVNFDLERAMSVRVCLEVIPNLASKRAVSCGQNQGQTTKTRDADLVPDFDTTANMDSNSNKNAELDKLETGEPSLDSFQLLELPASPEMSLEKYPTKNVNGMSSTSEMLSDVLSDFIETWAT